MMAGSKRFTGNVVKKRWGKGSKSDHMAVVLESGESFHRLRRVGGNPFFDEELEKLVGKKIEVKGSLMDPYTILLTSWQELDESG